MEEWQRRVAWKEWQQKSGNLTNLLWCLVGSTEKDPLFSGSHLGAGLGVTLTLKQVSGLNSH